MSLQEGRIFQISLPHGSSPTPASSPLLEIRRSDTLGIAETRYHLSKFDIDQASMKDEEIDKVNKKRGNSWVYASKNEYQGQRRDRKKEEERKKRDMKETQVRYNHETGREIYLTRVPYPASLQTTEGEQKIPSPNPFFACSAHCIQTMPCHAFDQTDEGTDRAEAQPSRRPTPTPFAMHPSQSLRTLAIQTIRIKELRPLRQEPFYHPLVPFSVSTHLSPNLIKPSSLTRSHILKQLQNLA